MAIGFGGTIGAGSTDAITTGFTSHSTNRTWFFIFNRGGTGGGGFGRIFDKYDGSVSVERISWSGSNFNFVRRYTGDAGWDMVALNTLNTTFRIAISYNSSTQANTPVVYSNGSAITPVRGSSTSGTAVTNSSPYVIGNRSDGIRNWDGWIAEFAIWDRLLTATEMQLLTAGAPVLSIPIPVFYMPLISKDSPIQLMSGGGTSTVTASANFAHPSTVYSQ